MVIRFASSFRGLVIWFCVSGVLALLGLAGTETADACGEWGYVVKNATTCEASGGLKFAYFFGANCGLAALSIIWALVKQGKQKTGPYGY